MEKDNKFKTLDGWSIFQGLLLLVITMSATYAVSQLSNLNQSVNDLNKNMSSVITDMANQKTVINQHHEMFKSQDERIRALEIKSPGI